MNSQKFAKQAAASLIREHGANGAILALAAALADLGPEWRERTDLPPDHPQRKDGPCTGIELVTGYTPHREDDWKAVERPKPPRGGDPILRALWGGR